MTSTAYPTVGAANIAARRRCGVGSEVDGARDHSASSCERHAGGLIDKGRENTN